MRVGIFGVAGFNRGDDAISFSLARWIRDRVPTAELTVAVLRDMEGHLECANKQVVINRRSVGGLIRLARAIRRQDVILLGGGSLIQDKHGGGKVKGPLGYAWFVTFFARMLGRPVMSVALGVDHLGTSQGRAAAKQVLGRLHRISVRDPLSAANVRDLVGPAVAIMETPDPAFSYGKGAIRAQADDYVVLAPAFEGVDEGMIASIFAEIAARILAEHKSFHVKIISMEERAEEDAGKIHRIRDALPAEDRQRVSLVSPTSAIEACNILRGGRGVVAMRLHALILAYGFSPLFCLSRTTKTEALMRGYLIAGREMNDLGDDLPTSVMHALHDSEHHKAQAALRVELDQRMIVAADTLVSTITELATSKG